MQVFFLYLEEIDEKLVLFKNNMKSRVVTLRVNCYTNCLSILINRSYSLFYHIYIYTQSLSSVRAWWHWISVIMRLDSTVLKLNLKPKFIVGIALPKLMLFLPFNVTEPPWQYMTNIAVFRHSLWQQYFCDWLIVTILSL